MELYSDCSGLLELHGKHLCGIENKRFQRILTRAQSFNFVRHHVPGDSNEIADCLSRLCGVDQNFLTKNFLDLTFLNKKITIKRTTILNLMGFDTIEIDYVL